MPRRVIYLLDQDANLQIPSEDLSHSEVFLCPLTADEAWIKSATDQLKTSGVSVTVLPYVQKFHQKAFEIRWDFVNFLSQFANLKEFSGKSFKEYFRCPHESFSLWWTSLLAEQNPVKSDAYNQIISVLTILEFCEEKGCDTIGLDVGNDALARTIEGNCTPRRGKLVCRNYRRKLAFPESFYGFLHFVNGLLSYVFLAMRIFRTKLIVKSHPQRKRDDQKDSQVFIASVPQFNLNVDHRGDPTNRYYGPLQKNFEQRYEDSFSWLIMPLSMGRLHSRDELKFLKDVTAQQRHFFFLEEFLGPKELFLILKNYLVAIFRFTLQFKGIKKYFQYSDKHIYIWPLFNREWYTSFSGKFLLEGLSYYYAFKGFLDGISTPSTIYHMAEIHAWEKALHSAADGRPHITTVGIQHSIVSLLLLFYFHPVEDLIEGDCIKQMPKPKFLGCVGPTPYRLIQETGWDKNRLFIVGPMRFQHFKENLKQRVPWAKKKNQVVVALTISPFESAEILEYIYIAYGGGRGYRVVIKEHPHCPGAPLLKNSKIRLDENIFQLSSQPLNDLLKESKILVVTESTAALDALSCGCRVVIPRLFNIVDMNPLSGLSQLPRYANSPQELSKITDQIFQQQEDKNYERESEGFINEYFEFVDSPDEWLGRLDKILNAFKGPHR